MTLWKKSVNYCLQIVLDVGLCLWPVSSAEARELFIVRSKGCTYAVQSAIRWWRRNSICVCWAEFFSYNYWSYFARSHSLFRQCPFGLLACASLRPLSPLATTICVIQKRWWWWGAKMQGTLDKRRSRLWKMDTPEYVDPSCLVGFQGINKN